MLNSAKGKIYLSGQRGQLQHGDWYRQLSTLNIENNQDFGTGTFWPLQAFYDEALQSGHTLEVNINEKSTVLLLPLVGALGYTNAKNDSVLINSGEALLLPSEQGDHFHIQNPHNNGLINFLQIRWKALSAKNIKNTERDAFDLGKHINKLIPLFGTTTGEMLHIGKFEGRTDHIYQLKNAGNGLFIFVIEGAFEVQGRLLESRDSLALWELGEVEFEALSNNAILLVMEVQLA